MKLQIGDLVYIDKFAIEEQPFINLQPDEIEMLNKLSNKKWKIIEKNLDDYTLNTKIDGINDEKIWCYFNKEELIHAKSFDFKQELEKIKKL